MKFNTSSSGQEEKYVEYCTYHMVRMVESEEVR